MTTPATTYHLTRPEAPPLGGPRLDESQRAVVDHEAGPLLVLAGPGTGKTTTLVEAIVDRIERRGVSPESVLALTFSRKAAEQLRDQVTTRLARTVTGTLCATFHSFAYGLVRRYSPSDLYAEPLRLLSAPEQDTVLTELLSRERESVTWPAALGEAVGTRGFAREVQDVLARAREKGLDPVDLAELGAREGRPEWQAAATFMEQYLSVLDSASALDYPELMYRAVLLAEDPARRAELRAQYSWVLVDEYQDTDPTQVRLLHALAGDGRNLVVVGDPDQSIYAFRGAEVRGILDFPSVFPRRDGSSAPVVALRSTRRFGPRLLTASRELARRLPVGGAIDAERFATFRDPQVALEAAELVGPGRVEVQLFDTPRAETEHVADALRRAHLEDGLDWSQMAVLVRSGRVSIPALRRSLGAAGVPVEVAADETPLVHEPALLPLLDGLRVALHRDVTDPYERGYVHAGVAEGLLVSPLGGLDAHGVRSLARLLRRRDQSRAADEGRAPEASPALLRAALLDPTFLDGLAGGPVAKARALSELLREAHDRVKQGATAEEVLWTLWDGTGWPQRLRRASESAGAAARLAHRDLDAICALFEVAARTEEKRLHTGVARFLEELDSQRIPADTLAERGIRGDAVRLLTAHRAKGLQWRFVVVAGVQDGSWPDLRRRDTLLGADRIGVGVAVPPVSTTTLLAEERRLFYVACTRARARLLVTAVESPEDDGDQPSRFVHELGVQPERTVGRPRRPLSMAGLVAELRRTVCDPQAEPALRDAAARRLALLATERAGDTPMVPQADPGSWWGTRARSVASRPVRPADAPLALSASALVGLVGCPMRWFLEREAGGARPAGSAQGFGLVVHALADRVAKGELVDAEQIRPLIDRVWSELSFETPWARARQRAEVDKVVDRFLAWHHAPEARTVVASELPFEVAVRLPDGEQVRLRGTVDRLELDDDGRAVVVDLKTQKKAATAAELAEHPQLGVYQLAVDSGGFDEHLPRPGRSGGAELVQLRAASGPQAKVQRQPPQDDDLGGVAGGDTGGVAGDDLGGVAGDDTDGARLVETQLMTAAHAVRSERFEARPGDHCRHCSFTAICPSRGSGTVLS
ncbi:MAG TPA: ATP-dependent DNA helicase [Nocardioidaceae bacterium]|nr:ATP-dependent DNA helicase [Nocardioidaceae bacterium]